MHELGCHRDISVVLPQTITSEVLLACGIRSAQTNKPFQIAGGKQLSGTKVQTQRLCKGFKSTKKQNGTPCITPPLRVAGFWHRNSSVSPQTFGYGIVKLLDTILTVKQLHTALEQGYTKSVLTLIACDLLDIYTDP